MSLQYQNLFNTYVRKTARPMSAYHYSSIFAWSDHFDFCFEVIKDQLCVFAYQGKDSLLYLPPLGDHVDMDVVKECFRVMGGRSIARIENIMDNQLPSFKAGGYNVHEKAQEYVYRNKDLQDLSGPGFKSKRHDVHVFLKRFPQAVFRDFTPKDQSGCAALYAAWAQGRRQKESDPIYVQMLEENVGVHAKLISHADPLGFIGRIVEIDGVIVGYTFGYPLNETTFCVALEIVDLNRSGLAAFIFNSFCKDTLVRGFDLINTMDDFGMPNIAHAKMSYHPVHQMPIYNIKENK